MQGSRWEDRGCLRCEELEYLLDAMQGLSDRLDDEVDSLSIQLHVARQELFDARRECAEIRALADRYEDQLIIRRREYPNAEF